MPHTLNWDEVKVHLKKMRPIYIQPSWPNKLGQLIKDLLHGQNKIFSWRTKQAIPASSPWSPSINCKLYNVHCMLFVCKPWNETIVTYSALFLQYKFGDVKLCSQLKHITSKSMGNCNKTAHKYLIVIDILCMNEFLPKENEPSFVKKKCSFCQ